MCKLSDAYTSEIHWILLFVNLIEFWTSILQDIFKLIQHLVLSGRGKKFQIFFRHIYTMFDHLENGWKTTHVEDYVATSLSNLHQGGRVPSLISILPWWWVPFHPKPARTDPIPVGTNTISSRKCFFEDSTLAPKLVHLFIDMGVLFISRYQAPCIHCITVESLHKDLCTRYIQKLRPSILFTFKLY